MPVCPKHSNVALLPESGFRTQERSGSTQTEHTSLLVASAEKTFGHYHKTLFQANLVSGTVIEHVLAMSHRQLAAISGQFTFVQGDCMRSVSAANIIQTYLI